MMFERNVKNIKNFRYLKCAAECSTSLKSVCPQIIFVFIKTELGLNTDCLNIFMDFSCFLNRNNEIETLVDCSARLDSQIIII